MVYRVGSSRRLESNLMQMKGKMHNRRLVTVFAIVFIDLLGFSLILPLLPYYADRFGATPAIVGLLTASYAAAQLIGAPVLGRLSDRYGRRPVLLLSIFGTFLGLVLLSVAEPLGRAIVDGLALRWLPVPTAVLVIMFVSRILDGLTGGNISVAQAYITDVTDEANRARGLGLVGAAFGLGFIIGPTVGGVLSAGGRYEVPAFFAAGLALLNWLAVLFWLPESLTPERRAMLAQLPTRSVLSPVALWHALRRPRFGPLLHIRLFFGLAFAMFTGIFALFSQYRLGLNSSQTSYLLAYVGLLSVFVQGVVIGRLTQQFRENHLILAATGIVAVSLLAWAFTPNVLVLVLILAPLALGTGILNTVINSAITKAVSPEEVGGALGISSSLESLTRAISPVVGGLLLGWWGTWVPGLIGAVLMGWRVTFVWRRLIVNPDPPLPV